MKNELDNIDLRSEEVQDILTRVPHWMIRFGSVVFLGLILMLLFISWMVRYPDVIQSQAVITTKIPPQKVLAKVTGRIDTILVEENVLVRQGRPLAILENTADYQDVFRLKKITDTLKLQSGKLNFPLEQIPSLSLGDIDTEYASFQNSYLQYSLNHDLQPFSKQRIADEITLNEQRNRLSILQSQQQIEVNGLDLKANEFERNESLFKKGIISAQEYESKKLKYLQARQEFKNLNISISQRKEAIAMARKNLASTSIERTREGMKLFKSLLQSLNQLKIAIRTWESNYILSSEIDGKVAFMNYWSENQTVAKGDLVFTVIPTENSSYIAKLVTPAQKSGKIHVGQRVQIDLKSFPGNEFGFLEGKVERVSMLPDENGSYLIDVSLPPNLITSYQKEIEFKQEMAGTAAIVTEDLRLMERFFYQLKEIFRR